jgi:hypothetical protein
MQTILITKDPKVAKYADESGVDRVMVDLEILGKNERQGHLNTVISKHTIDDVISVKKEIKNSKLLVRINPINENSQEEIDNVINAGAEIVMLPMFKDSNEVKEFISYVNKRSIVCLLLETPEALVRIDDILKIPGIDEIHIGLNDLHLSMGLNFMFELLSGGIVEYLGKKIKKSDVKFGFGGVARLGTGVLNAELILSEHYRLGSEIVILSRDFKGGVEDYNELIKKVDLKKEISKIHDYFNSLKNVDDDYLLNNAKILKSKVNIIRSK